jgi:hypothetical protein
MRTQTPPLRKAISHNNKRNWGKSKKKIIIIKIASSWKSDDSSKAPIVCEPIKVFPPQKKVSGVTYTRKVGEKESALAIEVRLEWVKHVSR